MDVSRHLSRMGLLFQCTSVRKMANATARIVVQMTVAQKCAIVNTAKRLDLNISELIRQAALGFTPLHQEQELYQAIAQVDASTAEARAAVDDVLIFVAESDQRIAAMATGRCA